jgi:hypothetical protein
VTNTWENSAEILFGGSLGSGQRNATTNVPGISSYSSAVGKVLPVGNEQIRSVTFPSTDSLDYTQSTNSVPIHVDPGNLTQASQVSTSVLERKISGTISVAVTVANTGETPALNVKLTGAAIDGAAAPAAPIVLGLILAHGQTNTMLIFSNVGAACSRLVLAMSGASAGCVFTRSLGGTHP